MHSDDLAEILGGFLIISALIYFLYTVWDDHRMIKIAFDQQQERIHELSKTAIC